MHASYQHRNLLYWHASSYCVSSAVRYLKKLSFTINCWGTELPQMSTARKQARTARPRPHTKVKHCNLSGHDCQPSLGAKTCHIPKTLLADFASRFCRVQMVGNHALVCTRCLVCHVMGLYNTCTQGGLYDACTKWCMHRSR